MRFVRPAAALAGLALLLTGCGQVAPTTTSDPAASGDAPAPQDTTKVSIAMEAWLGYGAWYIAEDQGYFAANGIEADLPMFDSDADMVAAFVSGQVQAMNVASHTALKMMEDGVDMKVVLLEDASTSADAIIATGDVKTVADLKGKKVAYEEGATSDLLLNYALAQNGMTIADIEKMPMNASDAGTALIAGQVPAAVTYEPYITAAQGAGSVNIVYEAGAKPGLISDVLAVRSDFIASNPAAVTALVKSWGQAVDYYNSNTENARAIISKGLGESPEDLATAFDGVQYFDLAENKAQLTGEFLKTTYPDLQQAAVAANLIQGTVSPAEAVDLTAINAAG
ncbi:MAG: ABC transporter substrate-binding protein [Propionibacteriaceae bacterium]|jgi:NitT/TauT family transport system substrate-binding protein|nr:ABC transporter substrate-binding protein [Propionibacteriaceae bacterium]